MRNTTGWLLPVPSADTDPDDVPDHLGSFGDAVDSVLGSTGGTLASRPTTGKPGQLYFITSGTNLGLLYRWNSTTNVWDQVNIGAGVTSDVGTIGWGDTPNVGTPSKGYAPVDHRHGSQTNPVIAHVAASDPHPQYDIPFVGPLTSGVSITRASGVPATGFSYWFTKWGRMVMMYINFTLSGSLATGSSGNLANKLILTVNDTRFHPLAPAALMNGAAGPVMDYYIAGDGEITMAASVPNVTYPAGYAFSAAGCFIAPNTSV